MKERKGQEKGVGTASRSPLVVTAFVLSAVMLAYEIFLTRIASVMLTSQYIFFLIVGVFLLGISVGAIIKYVQARRSTI